MPSLLNNDGGYHNYNAPPTSVLPVCHLSEDGQRTIDSAYWWFLKWPTKDGKHNFKYSTFNARADKLQSINLWKSVISVSVNSTSHSTNAHLFEWLAVKFIVLPYD